MLDLKDFVVMDGEQLAPKFRKIMSLEVRRGNVAAIMVEHNERTTRFQITGYVENPRINDRINSCGRCIFGDKVHDIYWNKVGVSGKYTEVMASLILPKEILADSIDTQGSTLHRVINKIIDSIYP